MAVWSTGEVSGDAQCIDHAIDGLMTVVCERKALRPHRLEHMRTKGYRLCA